MVRRERKAPGNWERKNPPKEKSKEHGDIPLRPEREPKERFPLPDYELKRSPGKTTLG